MYTPSDDDVLLLKAAEDGNLERLKKFAMDACDEEGFRKRCDIVQDCPGKRSIHYAAINGNFHICKFLVEKVKVSIDVKTDTGESALLLACRSGQTINAKYLIIRGADVALSDCRGITPLHNAARKGNKELMQLLMLKGADIEVQSVDGTPLQHAASCGNVESLRFLLDHGANPNSASPISISPITWAITRCSRECFELLLKAGADPNISSYGKSPLAHAALKGKVDFVRALLSAGANPDSVGTGFMTPIEYAALSGEHEAVRILFPVASRVPIFPDWSISCILNYTDSNEAKKQRREKKNLHFRIASLRGKEAAEGKDYADAIKWYTEATYLYPTNETVLLNRSLCWIHVHEPVFALHDAEVCVRRKPDWSMAHYMEGQAWSLLKNYQMACISFANALNLDPQSEEIDKSFRNVLYYRYRDLATKFPLEVMKIFADVNV